MNPTTALAEPAAKVGRLLANVETVVQGKRQAVTLAVVGLLAEGHVLIEDVPGTGKTTLARALARSIEADFRRVQFTSDMLPGDVLGVSIWSERDESFRFQRGPVFANIVLADELNRTSPRTQSALLEAMSEGRVSEDGLAYELPRPFFVIATQNPVEFEGTYPLPESQLDRFLLRIRMGYPDRDAERALLQARAVTDPLDALQPVLSLAEVQQLVAACRRVSVDPALIEYTLSLVAATREHGQLLLGASPRASLGLVRAARAHALVEGRAFCVPDDFKALFVPVIGHRIIAGPGRSDRDGEELLAEILDRTPVPE